MLTNILCYTCAGRLRADVLIAFATLLTLGWSSLPIMRCNVVIIVIIVVLVIITIIFIDIIISVIIVIVVLICVIILGLVLNPIFTFV